MKARKPAADQRGPRRRRVVTAKTMAQKTASATTRCSDRAAPAATDADATNGSTRKVRAAARRLSSVTDNPLTIAATAPSRATPGGWFAAEATAALMPSETAA